MGRLPLDHKTTRPVLDHKTNSDHQTSSDHENPAARGAAGSVLAQAIELVNLDHVALHPKDDRDWYVRKTTLDYARRLKGKMLEIEPTAEIARELDAGDERLLRAPAAELARRLDADPEVVEMAIGYSWAKAKFPSAPLWSEAVRKAKHEPTADLLDDNASPRHRLAFSIVYAMQTMHYPAGISSISLGKAIGITPRGASDILNKMMERDQIDCIDPEYIPGKKTRGFRVSHWNAGTHYRVQPGAAPLLTAYRVRGGDDVPSASIIEL